MKPFVRVLAVWAALTLLLLASAGQAGAQETGSETEGQLDNKVQILSVDETDDEITLEVAVPPSFGELALVERNFGVIDGGQVVTGFIVSPVVSAAADTVLVLDTSGSMRGPALAAAKTAARSFIETLPAETRVGLVTFGETVLIQQEPTLDRASVLAAIDGLGAADGETALWEALVTGADLIDESRQGGSSVVVLSDGRNTVESATQSEAVAHLSAGSTVLYVVAIESPDIDLVALQETVDLVDGQLVTASDINDLDALYTDIAGRLANRYQLRFTPTQNGTRSVVVSVTPNGSDAVATATTTIMGTLDGEPGLDQPITGEDPTPDESAAPVLNAEDLPVLGPVAVPTLGPLAQPTMFWVGVGSMFGAFALVGLLVTRQPTHVRLATATGADRLAGLNAKLGQTADRLIARPDREHPLDTRLDAADINLRPGEFLLVWLLGTLLTGLTISVLSGPVLGVLIAPLSVGGVLLVLNVRANRRRSRFADQLAETLGIMASSLRAGQSLHQSIELVATEAPSPTAEQFNRIHFEIRVGRDLTESMREVARRMQSQDLEWLAQAVDIHRELGGDLTEILDNVASTIRERRTVARQVDALSAEGRVTGYVLLGMPIVLFLFAWWRNPGNVDPMLTEPLGRLLLAIAVGGMAIGHLWIRQLVKLKY